MTSAQQLEQIFGVPFQQQADLTALRQFHANNAFCENGEGVIIGICACDNDFDAIRLPGSDFQNLEYLNLSDNQQLKRLTIEGTLPALRHLDISDSKLETLTLPAECKSLQYLDISRNQLQQFQVESSLPALTYLDLSGNQLQHLSLDAPVLQYAYLIDNKLTAITFQSVPKLLEVLQLKNNQLESLPVNLLEFSSLKVLYLYGNPLPGIPKEIISEEESGNSLEEIRNYLQEFRKGTIINERAKLIIVGNGRVGKTSIYRRLADEPFNRLESYTHGIQLGELAKKDLPQVKTDSLQLRVWDFGGQEIFFATHQFFLSEEAIYLLAWTDEQNVLPYRERDKGDLPYDKKWRTCEYWLENIRLHGKGSPIVMVQTHSDVIEHKKSSDASWEAPPYRAVLINFSAARDYGLAELKDLLSDRLNRAIPMLGQEFPETYNNAINAIEKLKETETSISYERFLNLCDQVDIERGGERSLLDYLVKAGIVVYFDKPLLKEVVYIDPNWLTGQVYALINKELRSRKGMIDQPYLKSILPDPAYDDRKRKQFVELLKSFELIFQPEGASFYIAPQYLPEKLEPTYQGFHDIIFKSLALGFVFHFPKFLPDNVMINFLSRYGPFSDRVYWKNGICFSDKNGTTGIVHFEEADRKLKVYSPHNEAGLTLQREICQAFVELSKKSNAAISLDGQVFASWQELERYQEIFPQYSDQQFFAIDGITPLYVKDFVHFFGKEAHMGEGAPKSHAKARHAGSGPKIYFSYAWGDLEEVGESREKVVNQLYTSLIDDGFNVLRDKMDLEYGGPIGAFMKELGKGDLIVVFISDKYAKSPNCMFELNEIARNSKLEEELFRTRILPVPVERIRFDDPDVLETYFQHWEEEEKKWEKLIQKRTQQTSDRQFKRYENARLINQRFGELSDWLADINTSTIDLLTDNNFELVKKAIKNRLEQLKDHQ